MLAKAVRIDLHRAFLVVAVIALLVLCVFLSLSFRKLNLNPVLRIPLISVPATITLYRGYYFQDLLHAALGTAVTSAAVHAALPNKHGVSAWEMYVLKVPYAFCYNLLGLVFWTDTNAATLNCTPIWIVNVAGRLGSIR
jgi:FtsH-binding integral membrane protein